MYSNIIGYGEYEKKISSKIKNISLEDAKEDYEKLRIIECKNINQRSLLGNKALDYFFFEKRLMTKSNKNINFFDFYRNIKNYENKPYFINFINYGKNRNTNYLTILYDFFKLYFGSIQSFKPIIAKSLYCKYKPTTILDFSAGWGGRALAAMSMDLNYIGFDTNKDLKNIYNKMCKTYKHNGNVKIYIKDSSKIDYSQYNYDMVFTSPPYFKENKLVETYKNMPVYKTKEEFNNNFLFPVVINSYKYLSNGGWFCLNIPKYMYEDLKKILGKANHKFLLNINTRNLQLKNLSSHDYEEYIYIWNK